MDEAHATNVHAIKMCEPFLNHAQACLAPKLSIFESRHVCKHSHKCASLATHITTKLPIELYISNTTTVLHGQKQFWEYIQTKCDQLTGPHGSLSNSTLLVHKPAVLQSCIPEK